jgi:MFS family permease
MFGSSVSMLGTRISTVAFPMLVLHINNSPLITGLVSFAVIAPSMLFYMPAGVLIDHCNPRRVMLISESLRGLAAFSVVGALVMFRPEVSVAFLILAMVAEEIFEIFSTLAERRYLNRVMERDKIDSRQASIEARTHAAVLAGRPVGPFLFSIRPYLPFLADALSFIASVISLFLVKKIDEPRVEAPLRPSEVISGIGQGFKWLKDRRRAWLTVLLMAMTSMVAQALILIFLVEAHSNQLSTVAIGVVLGASGVGGAVGSFCSRVVPAAIRSFWLPIQMAVWAMALSGLVLAGGNSVYLSAITMFILSLTGAIGNVEFGTYLIRNIADDMIAKVTGISQTVAIGASALGPVLGGSAVERFQVQGAVRILLVVVALMAIVSLLMPGTCRQVIRIIEAINPFALGASPANPGASGCARDATSERDRKSEYDAVGPGNSVSRGN